LCPSGLYLFVILILTFVSEHKVLIGLNCLGWGVPVVLVIAYAVPRALSSEMEHHLL
jgi:hypothetical protein